eukprot:GAHX01000255.1.p1 GENE.GAHX01000255.1~~GAHX01000255.1.p1  ORF type:complete len:492 (+),score=97.29 GAHX01000255.1:46-1476(+)
MENDLLKLSIPTDEPKFRLSTKLLGLKASSLDAMISYCRRNTDSVKKIYERLMLKKMNIWIDYNAIPKGVDWMQSILDGIERSNSFIFMLSPESLASEVCGHELDHAIKNNKRIIPVVIKEVSYDNVRPELSHINWIFMRGGQDKGAGDDFDKGIDEIIDVIKKDEDHIRFHTLLLNKSIEWQKSGNKDTLLLEPFYQEDSDNFYKKRDDKKIEPKPTALQILYVKASKEKWENQQFEKQLVNALKISSENNPEERLRKLKKSKTEKEAYLYKNKYRTKEVYKNKLEASIKYYSKRWMRIIQVISVIELIYGLYLVTLGVRISGHEDDNPVFIKFFNLSTIVFFILSFVSLYDLYLNWYVNELEFWFSAITYIEGFIIIINWASFVTFIWKTENYLNFIIFARLVGSVNIFCSRLKKKKRKIKRLKDGMNVKEIELMKVRSVNSIQRTEIEFLNKDLSNWRELRMKEVLDKFVQRD